MELCSGGDLYTRDPYTEAEAARITSAILSAVAFMHDLNVYVRVSQALLWLRIVSFLLPFMEPASPT